MSIALQFDSYEEMVVFARKVIGSEEELPVQAKVEDKPVKKKAAEKLVTEEPVEEESVSEERVIEAQSYTLEEVRAILTKLTKSGKSGEVKKLLLEFNADKLTAVEPKDYAALMEKAGAL